MAEKKFSMNKVLLILLLFLFSCEKNSVNNENELVVLGCTDSLAINYNTKANKNDNSCEYAGCTNPESVNFDNNATVDDGNCIDEEDVPDGYHLYWNDEFNQNSLDTSHWNMEVLWPGAFNNESQSYTKNQDNIFLQNGLLYIRALKEIPFNPNQPAYNSGRINTKDKVELKYGLWQIRAKLPSGVGTWPAIWMLNSNIDSEGWPFCGEIDIMEHVGYDPDRVFFSIHNGVLYGNVHGTEQQGVYELEGLENNFHIFSIEWDSTSIKGYIDGTMYYNYEKPAQSGYNSWPYDNPFFLIINLAIGGEWGGQQGIDNSIFPATFMIDYVRMFRKTI